MLFPPDCKLWSEDLTISELATAVAEEVGFAGTLRYDSDKPDGMPWKALDASRLRTMGWLPTVELRDGLADAYKWYAEHVAPVASPSTPCSLSRISGCRHRGLYPLARPRAERHPLPAPIPFWWKWMELGPPPLRATARPLRRSLSPTFRLALYPLARGCRRIRRGELMLDLLGPPSALRRRLGARW